MLGGKENQAKLRIKHFLEAGNRNSGEIKIQMPGAVRLIIGSLHGMGIRTSSNQRESNENRELTVP